jgi:hypothetical protein
MARIYTVLDREFLSGFGVKPLSDSPFNAHALVTVKATKEGNEYHSMTVDSVIAWGFKEGNLQMQADKRNESIQKMRDHLDSKEIEID